jgi:hypothetical protein
MTASLTRGVMKTSLLITALLTSLASPAFAVDILMVVLDQSGVKSIHHQAIPSDQCRKFLTMFRQHIREGKLPVILTFKTPGINNAGNIISEATGEVLSANCVLPNGSIETVDLPTVQK